MFDGRPPTWPGARPLYRAVNPVQFVFTTVSPDRARRAPQQVDWYWHSAHLVRMPPMAGDELHHHDSVKAHSHDESGFRGWISHRLTPHSHDSKDQLDDVLSTSKLGLRALWVSLLGMALTAFLQLVIVFYTGSVALLSDTLHNFADALTAIPLAAAFLIGRRSANKRYTYGYGRAEDLAGLAVLFMIALSAIMAGASAIDRLFNPQQMDHIWAVALAGCIGFLGNEAVARYRMKVGNKIGSEALVADGRHARVDGFTSLAVLVSAGGAALGWEWVDPVVGLGITVMILIVLKGASRSIYYRLMDAVDPEITDRAAALVLAVNGVRGYEKLQLRWIGHSINAECDISVDPDITIAQAHRIAHAVEDALKQIPRLTSATVHASPVAAPPTGVEQG